MEPLATLLRQAADARAQGRGEIERDLLTRAVAGHPDDPQAHNARGMRALADGDHALATASFTRAAALDAEEPALRINLATAARAAGDRATERLALQAALDIDLRHFTAQLRMAELDEREGQDAAAAQHWSAVVQLAAGMAQRTPAVEDACTRGTAFLQRHNAALGDAIAREFGGATPAGAEERRFQACVDTMLGRRRIYTNECAGIHYPFLPADEYFDRALFPWFAALEARTGAIRREAIALMEQGAAAMRPYVRLDKGTPQNKWSALDQSLDWSACFLWEYGEPNEAVCALCPETVAALEAVPQNRIPGKAPTAFFSILRPGAHIPPHTGVTNTRTIIHLPLVVPEGCTFRVGGETRPWIEGQAFAFDDTIEHEAWNPTDRMRIVLIFDVWNPHLTLGEQANLTRLFATVDRGLSSARA